MLSEILLITGNKSKIKEISTILGEYGIRVYPKNLDIPEYREDTLEDVSKMKARIAFEHFKQPLLVDDTGIFFTAYQDFPGVVTRFIFEKIGFDGILRLVKEKHRGAFYKSCITYIDSKLEPQVFEGEFHGTLAEKPSEILDLHFPYDSIFIPEGETLPRIELNYEKRIEASHRRKALLQFCNWIKK